MLGSASAGTGRENIAVPYCMAIIALVLVVGCAAPSPPPLAVLGPLNSEPWVSTQYPPGLYTTAPDRVPFQTPNSLPLGAYNLSGGW